MMILQSDYKVIKNSDLFDERYYLITYEDVRKADIDPIKHYLNHGWEEGRNPSEKFDTNFYLETYQDVKTSGMNPLVHFLRYGSKEKRVTTSRDNIVIEHQISRIEQISKLVKLIKSKPILVKKFVMEMQRNGLSEAIEKVRNKIDIDKKKSDCDFFEGFESIYKTFNVVPHYFNPIKNHELGFQGINKTVAIHLHIHYTEMIDECIKYLNNIPVKYDLYVSITQKNELNRINDQLSQLVHNKEKLIIKLVPNRGRDISPLIVEFGKALLKYDYIAHFHTKKSPHNSQLSSWFHNNMDLLFGSKNTVIQVFELLAQDAKIVYPENYIDTRFENKGWGNNYRDAKEILEKYTSYNINNFPYIEFPQGMIFWAKSQCLKDLLTLPLKYNDFSKEPIGADGTIAHTLERIIFVMALKYEGKNYRIHKDNAFGNCNFYENQIDFSKLITKNSIKILSYYLPQFHPTPENDLWHGMGFTEWHKVTTANPLFINHYQQHIPHKDIGYYLIDSTEIFKKQLDMMKKSGVYGQIFYHYWFTGKLILEKPAQMLLEDTTIDMPFCFCWANENWTKRWDGNEQEILLGQEYSAEDAIDFINYLIPFFKDSRYIKINNRPVLYIYRPSSFPDFGMYKEVWDEECRKNNIPCPYIVATLTRGAEEPYVYKMDAAVERVLHDWTNGNVPDIKNMQYCFQELKGSVLDYEKVLDYYSSQKDKKDYTYFRSLIPMWDNTARYGQDAYIVHNSTPELFQRWMEHAIQYTEATLSDEEQYIIINAWNEWAEGAHLEPDSKHGFAYLNSIGRALSNQRYHATNLLDNKYLYEKITISISFSIDMLKNLGIFEKQRKQFEESLKNSSLVAKAKFVSSDELTVKILHTMGIKCEFVLENINLRLNFHNLCVFDNSFLEKLLSKSYVESSYLIVPNVINDLELSIVNEDDLCDPININKHPIVVWNSSSSIHCRKYHICYDAVCAVLNTKNIDLVYENVTTIIRFHKNGNLLLLKNALLSLIAQKNCFVYPLIAAQDLLVNDKINLNNMLKSLPWSDDVFPEVIHYESDTEVRDLRSIMLNESFKQAKTRYVAFLDYDDTLFNNAYSWLLKRLRVTKKNASFGHVYSSKYDGYKMRVLSREKRYEYGFTYEDFITNNHAPLHSIMFDKSLINIENITYYPDMKYMEDYFFTLQIFTKDDTDWDSLQVKKYIGDYMHIVNFNENTLAIDSEAKRQEILNHPFYNQCQERIYQLIYQMKNKGL